jgi:hypothetical protein
VARVVGHQRAVDAAAGAEAGAVVAQQPVVGERRFVDERLGKCGGDAPVDEHHGLA